MFNNLPIEIVRKIIEMIPLYERQGLEKKFIKKLTKFLKYPRDEKGIAIKNISYYNEFRFKSQTNKIKLRRINNHYFYYRIKNFDFQFYVNIHYNSEDITCELRIFPQWNISTKLSHTMMSDKLLDNLPVHTIETHQTKDGVVIYWIYPNNNPGYIDPFLNFFTSTQNILNDASENIQKIILNIKSIYSHCKIV